VDATVSVSAGPVTGRTIRVTDEPLLIGRAAEGEGNIDDPAVSRRHALLRVVADGVAIEDLGSTNGTFINGRRIRGPAVARPGDVLWLGNSTLTVNAAEDSASIVAPIEPPAPSGESRALSRFAELSDNHPRRILTGVAVFSVVAALFGASVPNLLAKNSGGFGDPHGQAAKTERQLAAAAGELPDAQLIVLVRGRRSVTAAQTRQQVDDLAAAVRRDPVVTRTLTYYDTGSDAYVSRDRRSTLIAAFFKNVSETERGDAAKRIAKRIEQPPDVLLGGVALANKDLNDRVDADLSKAELFAFPLLFLLSLYVFRAVVAALLPLIVGAITILTTFLALRIVNEFVGLSPFALNVVVGLGLGLAIDYSPFIVSRFREETANVDKTTAEPSSFAGSRSEALRRTVYTAGRTVLYSACTVAIALATLIVFPLPLLYSMGIGGALTALIAVTVSLVALPSLLAVLGERVNAGTFARWRRAAQRTARHESEGPWFRLAQAVMRRPGVVAVTSAGLLIALGVPALGLHLTDVDISSLPPDLTPRKVDETLNRDFPSDASNQVTVVVSAPSSRRSDVESFAASLRRLPGANPNAVDRPVLVGNDLWEVPVVSEHRPLDARTVHLVNLIRAGPNPFPVAVTGDTAKFLDQRSAIRSHLPVAAILLVVATLCVLFLMTGSVVLPVKSLVMNALSMSAALGLVVLIFQDGHLEGLLGFHSVGAIDQAEPVLLFAIAFGLATDYGVFLITRIKEAYTRGESNRDAVAFGLERTGRIVTQAAILFCVAIGAFAASSVLFLKEIGLGTALALIIDASVIRAFLVPSLMALLGERNWWSPGPLRRLHNKIGLSES
jgi:uncharacterized membrane protein YdfJ with MMPL/SSD domain